MVNDERGCLSVGAVYEAGLDPVARRRGAHYTPHDVASTLVTRVLRQWRGIGPPVMCDPACGGGVFLVAAADALAQSGLDPRRIVDELLIGVDLDAGAVATSIEALRLWSDEHGVSTSPRVLRADALAANARVDGRVDIVVGNPPFQSQMTSHNARTQGDRDQLVARFGDAARGYVDSAALFVVRALEMVRPGGVVALVLPRSFLAARDAAGVRAAVLGSGHVVECWIPGERLFDASVDVCVPLIRCGDGGSATQVVSGRQGDIARGSVSATALSGGTWSALLAAADRVPEITSVSSAVIGDVATATAGFRDQYYGFVGHVSDEPGPVGRWARLATTAMIDPGRCGWGRVDVRFAKQRWSSPHVDLDAVARETPALMRWVERMLVPKVIVATQTRTIEAVADVEGAYVPSTPLISVIPSGATSAEHIASALLAPPSAAWAFRRFGGAGMSAGALKLAARDVVQIPLPRDVEPWHEATGLLRAEGTDLDWPRIGTLLCDAWAVPAADVLRWWLERVI